MAVFQIKTMLQSARKYPQQNPKPYRNQPINLLCKSVDSFPHNTSLYQRYLQADLNGTFQGIKKKSRKSLFRSESYSESPEKSQTLPLSKKPINRSNPYAESSILDVRPGSVYSPIKNSV